MSIQAAVRTTFREAAVVSATETLDLSDATVAGILFVCYEVADRTAGSIAVTYQGSLDNSTWFELPAALGSTLNANGLVTHKIPDLATDLACPRYLRATLTRASFDGTLAVWTQTDVTLP